MRRVNFQEQACLGVCVQSLLLQTDARPRSSRAPGQFPLGRRHEGCLAGVNRVVNWVLKLHFPNLVRWGSGRAAHSAAKRACGHTCQPTWTPPPSLPAAGSSLLTVLLRSRPPDCRGGHPPAQRSPAPTRDAGLRRAGQRGVFCPWLAVHGALHPREPKPASVSTQPQAEKGD